MRPLKNPPPLHLLRDLVCLAPLRVVSPEFPVPLGGTALSIVPSNGRVSLSAYRSPPARNTRRLGTRRLPRPHGAF